MDILVAARLAAIPREQIQTFSIPLSIFSTTRPHEIIKILRTTHNERALIHRFTDETLASIFSYLLDDLSKNDRILKELSEVCCRWKKIVDENPHLWTSFQFTNERMAIRHAERSRGQLLEVAVNETLRGNRDWVGMLENLNRIGAVLPRVRSLHLTVDAWELATSVYGRVRQYKPSALTTLTVKASTPHLSDGGPVAFSTLTSIGPLMSNLTSLSLIDTRLDVFHQARGTPYNLRSLELTYTSSVAPPSSGTIIALLHRCPLLETLQLRSDAEPFRISAASRIRSISLPRLRTFSFEGLGVRALSHVLGLLDNSSALFETQYELQLSASDPDVLAWFQPQDSEEFGHHQAVAHIGLSFRRPLRGLCMDCTGSLALVLRGTYEPQPLAHDTADVDVSISIKAHGPPANVLCRKLHALPIDVTYVETFDAPSWLGTRWPAQSLEWSTVLEQMPNLTTLVVREPDAIESLCDGLQMFDSETDGFPCPRLSTITMINPVWGGPIYTALLTTMLKLRRDLTTDPYVKDHPLRVSLEYVDIWSSGDQQLLVAAGLTDLVSVRCAPCFY
ncbi:hypothetical protein BN946_scf185004.g24 [Trametes cinnabarina]|uniref:Uncharacterized protein n=1 Tax=Pycnoporus cinnabarinus TaxID=5643 RepID=A0A060SRP4_PYCCI|nr:hypothetical protein BN946_scf185004.g24 [Trametes cinnabarina]